MNISLGMYEQHLESFVDAIYFAQRNTKVCLALTLQLQATGSWWLTNRVWPEIANLEPRVRDPMLSHRLQEMERNVLRKHPFVSMIQHHCGVLEIPYSIAYMVHFDGFQPLAFTLRNSTTEELNAAYNDYMNVDIPDIQIRSDGSITLNRNGKVPTKVVVD